MRAVLTWDEHYLNQLPGVGRRSKDPNTQVGCIIALDNRRVGDGYNGFPPGFPDTKEHWQTPEKYKYVVHAEKNAIFNSATSVRGATMYVSVWPCAECAKDIAGAGIKRVVIGSDYYYNDTSEYIFAQCGIQVDTLIMPNLLKKEIHRT